MPIVNTVHGKYGPTIYLQHALHSGYSVYGSLEVTVRSGLSLTVNHTYSIRHSKVPITYV